jgi:hypothetical protein
MIRLMVQLYKHLARIIQHKCEIKLKMNYDIITN